MCKILCKKEDCKECFEKSFASHYRVKWWSPRNKAKPFEVSRSSNLKYEFLCDCGHYFSASMNHICNKNKGSWCPYCCKSARICEDENCEKCFEKSFASHPRIKWWSPRNTVNPRFITKQDASVKCEFLCDCGHYFLSALNHICNKKKESWCPYCCISGKKLCDDDNCKSCFEKSVASHPRSKYWSPRNEKTPRQMLLTSGFKAEFLCDCGHLFSSWIKTVCRSENPTWCPYCSDNCLQLCEKEDCKMCFERSFASHPRSKWWSPRNKVSPRQVAPGTHDKYEFQCEQCTHYFFKPISGVTNKSNASWCPHCGNSVICDDEKCEICFKNSFASHPRSKWWSERNTIAPTRIARRTGKKYEFKCEKGHYFFASPDNVSKEENPRWCPLCINKTEHFLLEWLKKYFPDVVYQYKVEWCRNPNTKKYLPFDFYLPSHNVIIELDGQQHFKKIGNWDAPEHTQSRDLYKIKMAYDRNITVIRIPAEFFETKTNTRMGLFHLFRTIESIKKPIHLIILDDDDDRYAYVQEYDFTKEDIPEILSKNKSPD